MHSLHQFTWVAGTSTYRHGGAALRITDAPSDADLTRWSMLHDGDAFRFYCFKGRSTDTLYQFSRDGEVYRFGHRSIPELKLVEFPDDADSDSFAMLHDGRDYRLFLRRKNDPHTLYQAAWVAGTPSYRFGHRSIDTIPITGFPESSDPSRWSTLHDGADYRIHIGRQGAPDHFYQGTYDRDAHAYRFDHHNLGDAPLVTLEGGPPNLHGLAMLHDGNDHHIYRQLYRQS